MNKIVLYRFISALFVLFLLTSNAHSQSNVHTSGFVQLANIFSKGDYAPYWLTAKSQGISSVENLNGYARCALSVEGKFKKNNDFGYKTVTDVIVGYNRERSIDFQQIYADFSWRWLTLTIGSKEHFGEMKDFCSFNSNAEVVKNRISRVFPGLYYKRFVDLSSGGLVYSGNSRPIPQLRLEIPEYLSVPKTNDWLKVRAHIAYGYFPDSDFQEEFTRGNAITRYSDNVLYHSKSLFMKVGREDKFPVTFEGGLEMHTQFGGDIYTHEKGKMLSMPSGAKEFFKAFIPMGGGEDTPEYEQTNISGNNIGSWHAALTIHTKVADIRLYGEHMFEDFSQLFFLEYQSDASGDRNLIYYPWRDFLVGVSVANKSDFLPFVSNISYEYVCTHNQSGACYNDPGPFFKEQMDGADNYYNHYIYAGWHNWGMGIGSPLAYSPVYNKNGSLQFASNRFIAHNVGVNGLFGGDSSLAYRLQYTYTEHWGTYLNPFREKKYTTSLLADILYAPARTKWAANISVAYDKSNFIGENIGMMFTISRMF